MTRRRRPLPGSDLLMALARSASESTEDDELYNRAFIAPSIRVTRQLPRPWSVLNKPTTSHPPTQTTPASPSPGARQLLPTVEHLLAKSTLTSQPPPTTGNSTRWLKRRREKLPVPNTQTTSEVTDTGSELLVTKIQNTLEHPPSTVKYHSNQIKFTLPSWPLDPLGPSRSLCTLDLLPNRICIHHKALFNTTHWEYGKQVGFLIGNLKDTFMMDHERTLILDRFDCGSMNHTYLVPTTLSHHDYAVPVSK
jgi:hypothetical protein